MYPSAGMPAFLKRGKMEEVVLVDLEDNEIGKEEKIAAHKKALLHRAISVLIFNRKKELLIQRRALTKYHCPGIWANTCCSHPRPGEKTLDAANRRLVEEMGIKAKLEERFSFVYRAEFDNGLVEYEFDHVFVGNYEMDPLINKDEVDSFRWISPEDLIEDIKKNPKKYAPWFLIILEKLYPGQAAFK